MKKFELTSEFITNIFGIKLFRIKALVEFGNVKVGELRLLEATMPLGSW